MSAEPTRQRRILRLAFGTGLSLWLSQVQGGSLSFVAPALTLTVLSLPLPRPGAKFFIAAALALVISIYGAFVFLPMLLHQRWAGLLLLGLALFHSFYFTARGGAAAIGLLITAGLTLVVAVGSVSVDALLVVAAGVSLAAPVGIGVAWLSHALLPDPPLHASAVKPPSPARPPLPIARRNAMRSLAVVLPISVWFLMSPASASNVAVMIKVAAMGQEASDVNVKDTARSLLMSTFAGGLAATLAWQVLVIWPSLPMYTLLVLLAGFWFGGRIFEGAGLRPDGQTWSYAYLTMIVVLAPAVTDSQFGSSADARFYDRLWMFVGATVYGVAAVYLFDAWWPKPRQSGLNSEADVRTDAASPATPSA